jgi:hypothetical protein
LIKEEYTKLIDDILLKKPEECTAEEKGWLAGEKALCERLFLYWLERYGRIIQAPTKTQPGGVVKVILWPHTLQIVDALLNNDYISILKSRQIGASWMIALYCTWQAVFHKNDKSLLFSKGEAEAMELLTKCKQAHDAQPWFLRLKYDGKSTTKIVFSETGSTIDALAPTENAGVGYQVSRIFFDEHIEYEYAAKLYMSAKPTIDSAGGQIISVFTSNENKLDSIAVSLFLGGLAGKNGFKSLFFPYTVRPGRDDKWYEQIKQSIPDEELRGLTPDVYMARNYPRSVEEALSPSKTIAVFDKKVLDGMIGETENGVVIPEIDNGIVHVYRPYTIGQYYIAASDTSHGIGKDFNVTIILNVKTGAVAADIYHSRLSPEELAYHSVKLLALYRNPLWVIEDNDWGRVTITTAQNLGYKNFAKTGAKLDRVGWHTDEKNRMDLWGSLIPAVNNHQIVIYNKDGLRTFYDIVRNAEKNGRIEAMGGRHDDYAFCLGLAYVNRDKVHVSADSYKPLKTLTFAR